MYENIKKYKKYSVGYDCSTTIRDRECKIIDDVRQQQSDLIRDMGEVIF